jgi:hypothetical protein
MIVSIHIPKTAGSSFKELLVRHFGQRTCLCYEQTPLRYRTEGHEIPPVEVGMRGDCAVVHGHFVADRLILPPGTVPRYAAWLRHPVERLISHYYFWIRQPYMDQPLCRRLVEERMDIEAFAAEDAMRDLQTFFLGQMPASRYAFIGITERFTESVERFNAAFGTELQTEHAVNANPDRKGDDYRTMVGVRTYDAIAALNPEDMALYDKVLATYS